MKYQKEFKKFCKHPTKITYNKLKDTIIYVVKGKTMDKDSGAYL